MNDLTDEEIHISAHTHSPGQTTRDGSPLLYLLQNEGADAFKIGDRFIAIGETDWTSPDPVPRDHLPFVSEHEALATIKFPA